MIGVFDSGFGGLTILKEFLKELPQYDYTYLGDNARTPYGNRSRETLIKFAEQSIEFLFKQNCKLIIIACNTATAVTLRHLQEKYLRQPGIKNLKILGVIRPLVEKVVTVTKNNRIGIVATTATVNSKSYEIEIKNLNPNIKTFSKACPLLVPFIEEGWHHKPEARMILKKYLLPLKSSNIDTLILGCTHYPFLYKEFCRIMGKKVTVLNSGEIVAKSLKDYLNRHPEIEKNFSKNKQQFYLTTDNAGKFKSFATTFLNLKIKNIRKIDLC